MLPTCRSLLCNHFLSRKRSGVRIPSGLQVASCRTNCVTLNPKDIFHVKHSASSVLNPLGRKAFSESVRHVAEHVSGYLDGLRWFTDFFRVRGLTWAEPVSALYARGAAHDVGARRALAERRDALVWAVSALFYPTEEEAVTLVYDSPVTISPF